MFTLHIRALILFVFILLYSSFSMAGSSDEAMIQSAAGMKAQGERMKVIAQNIANSSSTGQTPGAEPYRRKMIIFKNKTDKKTGYNVVQVEKIQNDKKAAFGKKFDPSHPAANADGYVLLPNVEPQLENVDMKEAQRGYEANLAALEMTKKIKNSTVDLLK